MGGATFLQHRLDVGTVAQQPGLLQVNAFEFGDANGVGAHALVGNHLDLAVEPAGQAEHRQRRNQGK